MSSNLYSDFREHVVTALRSLVDDLPQELAAKVEVTPAREAAHGDMATNAAMVVARHARAKPADLAAASVSSAAIRRSRRQCQLSFTGVVAA